MRCARQSSNERKKSPVRADKPNRAAERISTTRYCVPAAIISQPRGKGKRNMTLKEIMESDKAVLLAKDIAPVLECGEQAIRVQAQTKPEKLQFPVIAVGSRVKIPRIPFVEYMTKYRGKKS